MRAKIRDTEIYFDVEGSALVIDEQGIHEKPVAFLLHGGPGADHTAYKPHFSVLSNKMQLIYFDYRGQGRSTRGDKETYTLENNVEDIEALRQYLGLDKIVVIGESYGGMVALSYAVRYPQNVSHLIVIATASDSRFLQRAQEILEEKGTPEQKAVAQRVWNGTFENEMQMFEYWQLLMPMYSVVFKANPNLTAQYHGIPSPDATNVAFSSFLRSYNVSDQLHKIASPTLVISGQDDWFCAPEFAEDIAKGIKDADLRIFDNCGHSVAVDQPEALFNAIAEFLADNS